MTARCRARVVLLVVLMAGAIGGAAPAHGAGLEGVPAFGHVFVLMGENQGLDKLTPARSPFLTGTLEPRSAYLTATPARRSAARWPTTWRWSPGGSRAATWPTTCRARAATTRGTACSASSSARHGLARMGRVG